ncbi:hypothetical protein BR93DRAFT_75656 [Coniochaeta sp. PMI_546]|nr:hypothetical protein BR93DRAFT_75656 [Coniochaeta sp. PMI_546]
MISDVRACICRAVYTAPVVPLVCCAWPTFLKDFELRFWMALRSNSVLAVWRFDLHLSTHTTIVSRAGYFWPLRSRTPMSRFRTTRGHSVNLETSRWGC